MSQLNPNFDPPSTLMNAAAPVVFSPTFEVTSPLVIKQLNIAVQDALNAYVFHDNEIIINLFYNNPTLPFKGQVQLLYTKTGNTGDGPYPGRIANLAVTGYKLNGVTYTDTIYLFPGVTYQLSAQYTTTYSTTYAQGKNIQAYMEDNSRNKAYIQTQSVPSTVATVTPSQAFPGYSVVVAQAAKAKSDQMMMIIMIVLFVGVALAGAGLAYKLHKKGKF